MRFIRWMPAVTWAIFLLNASAKTHMRYGESSGSIMIASASNHSAFLTDTGYDLIISSADSPEFGATASNENDSKALSESHASKTALPYSAISWIFKGDGGCCSKINLLLIFPFHFFW